MSLPHRIFRLTSLLSALVLIALALPASAAVYTVTNTSDTGTGSLRDALAQGAADMDPSDDIDLSNVKGTITLRTGQLAIAKDTNLIGPGQGALTISGGRTSRVLQITAGAVTISDLTIANGQVNGTASQPQVGAGIDLEGFSTLAMTNCAITGCLASRATGGGLALNAGPNTLTNCTIAGNTAASFGTLGGAGGGLYVTQQTTLIGCTVSGNTASGTSGMGAGIYAGGETDLTNSTLTANTATVSGGGISNVSLVNLTSCTLAGNSTTSASGQGGGIYEAAGATLNLQAALIASNQAVSGPDIVCPGSASVTSLGSNLIGNGSGSQGLINGVQNDQVGTAAAPIKPMLGTLQLNEGTTQTLALLAGSPAIDADFTGNSPATDQRGIARPQGVRPDIGAYEIYSGRSLVVTNLNDSGTGSLRQAILLSSSDLNDTITFVSGLTGTIVLTSGELPVMQSVTITGPGATVLAVSGGGTSRVLHQKGGTVSVSGLTLTAGAAPTSGGGIFLESGTLSVDQCTLSGNSALNGSGGGISSGSSAHLTVTRTYFSGNSAQFGGGGLDGEGQVTVSSSTFSGNTVAGGGGGLLAAASATVYSSTFAGNTASEGGGILSRGVLTLRSCTISGNRTAASGTGGGLSASSGGQALVTGCLIAGNTAGTGGNDPDVEDGMGGTIVTGGSNLIGNGTGAPVFVNGTKSDQVGTAAAPIAPLLGPLQNNGGATPTLALLVGSPAIDADYTGTAPATDQRGFVRPRGARPDIGAFEYPSTLTHLLWNNVNGTASVWNYTENGTLTYHHYGPYDGWTAKGVADGPDGNTRLLWTNTDGRMMIWSLDNGTGAFTYNTYGPYPNWTAIGVSVGIDNTTHILWDNTDGTISLWSYQTSNGSFTYLHYGLYDGWTANAISDGPDGNTRLLWTNIDGRMSLESYTLNTKNYTVYYFGPFPGWTATALSVASDNTTHILWDNVNGTASIWNLLVSNGVPGVIYHHFGPYSGETATALADEPDGLTRVLWNSADGSAALWALNTQSGAFTYGILGPYAGWTADALAQGR